MLYNLPHNLPHATHFSQYVMEQTFTQAYLHRKPLQSAGEIIRQVGLSTRHQQMNETTRCRLTCAVRLAFITGAAMVLRPPAAPQLLRRTRIDPPDYKVSTKRAKGTPLRRWFQRASHCNAPEMLRSAKPDAPRVLIRRDVFSTQFRDLQRNRAAGCAGRRLKHAHITQHGTIYHSEKHGRIDALRSGNILLQHLGLRVQIHRASCSKCPRSCRSFFFPPVAQRSANRVINTVLRSQTHAPTKTPLRSAF